MKTKDNLGELFQEARIYGRVRLSTTTNLKYTCSIEFVTSSQTTLTASSDYNHKTPEEAVQVAIKQAKHIVSELDNVQTTIKKKITFWKNKKEA